MYIEYNGDIYHVFKPLLKAWRLRLSSFQLLYTL